MSKKNLLYFDPADVLSPADIAAINAGTKRAVGDTERLQQLLAQAQQFQTDVAPANHNPLKFACVQIEKLQDKVHKLRQILQDERELVLALDPNNGHFAEIPRFIAQYLDHAEVNKGWAP